MDRWSFILSRCKFKVENALFIATPPVKQRKGFFLVPMPEQTKKSSVFKTFNQNSKFEFSCFSFTGKAMSSIYSSLVSKSSSFPTRQSWPNKGPYHHGMMRWFEYEETATASLANCTLAQFFPTNSRNFSFLPLKTLPPPSRRRHGNALHPIKIFWSGRKTFFPGKTRVGSLFFFFLFWSVSLVPPPPLPCF